MAIKLGIHMTDEGMMLLQDFEVEIDGMNTLESHEPGSEAEDVILTPHLIIPTNEVQGSLLIPKIHRDIGQYRLIEDMIRLILENVHTLPTHYLHETETPQVRKQDRFNSQSIQNLLLRTRL